MPEFVYNRTQNHVDRLKALQAKGYPNLTEEELEEYHGYASLGAYNATDINRVEAAVAEIAPLYDLTLTTNTSRTYWTLPNKYAGGFHAPTYLSNVVVIRDAAQALYPNAEFPALPESMGNLTWELANNIEETLWLAYALMVGGTLTWDGVVTGLDTMLGTPPCYKVSDIVLTEEDVTDGVHMWVYRAGTEIEVEVVTNTPISGVFVIMHEASKMCVVSVDEIGAQKYGAPSAGTYFANTGIVYVSKLVITGYTGFLERE